MLYKLVFNIDPTPASRPRVGRYGVFYGEAYTKFREDMKSYMWTVKKTRFEEPLIVDITFWRKIPDSYSKKQKEELHGQYCVGNMDLDNLEKAIYDCLNDHVFVDDKQIVEHTTRKKWTNDTARIEITLKKINE